MQLAIIGTTASGKSDLAHELALFYKKDESLILSLDSLCVYKGLDIVTAKPSLAMQEELMYFGIDLIEVNAHFDVALFSAEYDRANAALNTGFKKLFITGGSSFYLYSLLSGLWPRVEKSLFYPEADFMRNELELVMKNPPHLRDALRLKKYWDIKEHMKALNIDLSMDEYLKLNTEDAKIASLLVFDLIWDKELLNKRIKKRSELMIKEGAIEEVELLYKSYGLVSALSCIGAKQCLDYIKGHIKSKEELIDLINIKTAQLAKRQRTFNKKISKLENVSYHALKIEQESDINHHKTYIKNYINNSC